VFTLDDGEYAISRDGYAIFQVKFADDGEIIGVVNQVDKNFETFTQDNYGDIADSYVSDSTPYYDDSGYRTGDKSTPYYDDTVYSAEVTTQDGGTRVGGVLASQLERLMQGGDSEQKKFKQEQKQREETAPKSKPEIEKENMTDKLRKELYGRLEFSAMIVSMVYREIKKDYLNPLKIKKTLIPDIKKNKDFGKLINRAEDWKAEYDLVSKELAESDDATSIRGKVVNLVKSAEKMARDKAKYYSEREDWIEQYNRIINEVIPQIAFEYTEEEGVNLTEEQIKRINKKLIAAAMKLPKYKELDTRDLRDVLEEVEEDIAEMLL